MSTTGPAGITTSGLIYHYDLASIKSYVGPPIKNIIPTIKPYTGTGTGYSFVGTSESLYIPELNEVVKARYVDVKNDYPGTSSNCCPNIFDYYINPITDNVAPLTTYTYAIVYKCKSDYTNGNFLYRYEYNGGTYRTEAGVFSNSRRQHLGDNWYWAWGTFTTTSSVDRLYLSSYYYKYQSYNDRMWVAKAALFSGSYTGLHPKHWPEPGLTRSSSFCLYDLAGGNEIKMDSASFDLSGSVSTHYVYTLDTPSLDLAGDKSLCLWIKMASDSACVIAGKSSNTDPGMSLAFGYDSQGFMNIANNSANIPYVAKDVSRDIGRWVYLAGVQSGTTRFIYVLDYMGMRASSSVSATHTWNNASSFNVGTVRGSTAVPAGTLIEHVSVYNRALTEAEVKNNFYATKNRFGV
jgi:hypothetical protein